MTDFVVAIDGPAGSGKSSVSREVARRLGYDYLDTGAAYRALAWHCLERGVDTLSADDVIEELPAFAYTISVDPDARWVRVGSEDVTDDIREPRISGTVSNVARIAAVREHVNALFRQLMAASPKPGIIVEGRDITTIVAPDAQVRILLTAAAEVRMARRVAELQTVATPEVTAQQLKDRDSQDSRVVDFMNAAEGVTTVDSTDLDFEQTVQAVADIVRRTLVP